MRKLARSVCRLAHRALDDRDLEAPLGVILAGVTVAAFLVVLFIRFGGR